MANPDNDNEFLVSRLKILQQEHDSLIVNGTESIRQSDSNSRQPPSYEQFQIPNASEQTRDQTTGEVPSSIEINKQWLNTLVTQNELLIKLNQFSLDLAMLGSEKSLEETILKGIREISGAEVATFSEYNPKTKILSSKHIDLDPANRGKLARGFGKSMPDIRIPVSDAMYQQMISTAVGGLGTFKEATFGSASRTFGALLQILFKVNRFIGVAYRIEGEVFGTTILALKKGTPDPPLRILGNFVNIASVSLRRKRAEEALRYSEDKYREMTDLLPQVVFETDLAGNLTYINRYANSLFGYDPDFDGLGMSVASFLIPQDRLRLAENIRQILLGKPYENGNEYTLIRKDGSEFQGLVYSTPILKNEVPSGIRGFIIDISSRKHAENELQNAKNRAEESDRLKTTFLANMSHEIRTPMNGILGFAELLREPDLTGEQQQQYVSIIEKSGVRMLNIINDIIDISKIESGLMSIKNSETNILEVMQYIETFFRPEVEAKGMELLCEMDLQPADSSIESDREKVIAILTNLVKNAIKYSSRGEIRFGCERKGDALEFYVKDTGIGIAPDKLEPVFKRFIQIDSSSTKTIQGNGLGLSIAKAYVEMLGGQIWVESVLGKGSGFYFTIPVRLN